LPALRHLVLRIPEPNGALARLRPLAQSLDVIELNGVSDPNAAAAASGPDCEAELRSIPDCRLRAVRRFTKHLPTWLCPALGHWSSRSRSKWPSRRLASPMRTRRYDRFARSLHSLFSLSLFSINVRLDHSLDDFAVFVIGCVHQPF
jgi:hypothetical protein